MTISLVVAYAENRSIGRDNELPWHLPDDLRRFKSLTTGHTIIMGRRTYESIGRALPNRRSIVLSRTPSFHAEDVATVSSLDEALHLCEGEEEVFVIGGHSVFDAALPIAHRIYLTLVHAEVAGDVFFPDYDAAEWNEVCREERGADDRHAFAFSFVTLHKKTLTGVR